MSKIGKKLIAIPSSASVEIRENSIKVSGPYGSLQKCYNKNLISIVKENNDLKIIPIISAAKSKAFQGLYRMLVKNMVDGVTSKFYKRLISTGIGFKFLLEKDFILLNLGFTNTIRVKVPEDIMVEVESPTILKISGIDKEKVGQFASTLKAFRPAEPYKARGIQYDNEIIKRKVGKTGK